MVNHQCKMWTRWSCCSCQKRKPPRIDRSHSQGSECALSSQIMFEQQQWNEPRTQKMCNVSFPWVKAENIWKNWVDVTFVWRGTVLFFARILCCLISWDLFTHPPPYTHTPPTPTPPPPHVRATRRVFPDMVVERNALMEHVYPKLKHFCRERFGLEFQVKAFQRGWFCFQCLRSNFDEAWQRTGRSPLRVAQGGVTACVLEVNPDLDRTGENDTSSCFAVRAHFLQHKTRWWHRSYQM